MKLILFASVLLMFRFVNAQAVSTEYILTAPKKITTAVNPDKADFFQNYLPFDFGGYKLSDLAAITKIKGKTIYKVQLVYSSYKGSDKFSQEKLNRKRIEELRLVLPELFENTAIEWELVEQTEDEDKSKAQSLFHGFILYSREMAYEKGGKIIPFTREDEMAWIKAKSEAADKILKSGRSPAKGYKLVKRKQQRVKAKYIPRSKRKREKGIRYDKRSIWRRKKEKTEKTAPVYDTVFSSSKEIDCFLPRDFYSTGYPSGARFDPLTTYSHQADTVVSMTLSSKEWKKTVVAEDVTGSMYPYITQTIVWRKFHIETTKLDEFAFFNDGDSYPDGAIGKSGGIGCVSSRKTSPVEDEVKVVMSKGNGGMGPENNIEASLKAVDEFKGLERILLIADNYAPVRDMEIFGKLEQVSIPVDVILCGAAYGGISSQYLEIARRTGGTVYTMEQTINGLADLKEGETVVVGKNKVMLRKGKFELVR